MLATQCSTVTGYAEGGRRHPKTTELTSVLLGKWFISGRSSIEGCLCCKQSLLQAVTVSRFKAIQGDLFQGSYQLGQRRAKLPFVLTHKLYRVGESDLVPFRRARPATIRS